MSYLERLDRGHFIKPAGAEPLRDYLKDVDGRVEKIEDSECQKALANTWLMLKLIFERENQNVAATADIVSTRLSGWAHNEKFMRKVGLSITDSSFGPFFIAGEFGAVLQEIEAAQEEATSCGDADKTAFLQDWSRTRCKKMLEQIDAHCTQWLERDEVSLLAVARYWFHWRWFGNPPSRSQSWCVVQ